MKLLIMAIATCFVSTALMAQLIKKEVMVQQIPKKPVIKIDCKSGIMQARAEYKPFTDYMGISPSPGTIQGLNFHVKYSSVSTSDSAMRNSYSNTESPSLTADFLTWERDCNTIIGNNIPFTSFENSTEVYNVTLATNFGRLQLKKVSNGATKAFTLTPIGYGIYTGSITSGSGSSAKKETVVVVLNRLSFYIGG